MKIPRIMFAAPSSGSGKTMITCGILQALVNRGLNVASFKCGPDYIDPMFHENVIGTRSRNLDIFFTGTETTRYLFGRAAENMDISVTEGVMGFYDGLGGSSVESSSYDVSQRLDMPVVLIVDCKGSSVSAVPLIKGFKEFRENNIKGVILNNMHEKVYAPIKEMIESELCIEAIGYVPPVKELVIESRHLGLILPSEVEGLKEKLNILAEILERTLDIDSLIRIAGSVPDFRYEQPVLRCDPVRIKIGVASDDCFCFIYKDNTELLERMGAEIVRFSPLRDAHLPEDISGIIIPGGYPELYAETLSKNLTMLRDIKDRTEEGMPCMAESGGFMYLHEELEDTSGTFHKMAGVIDGKAFRTGKLSKFGYAVITSKKEGMMKKGTKMKGHEFHYWDSTDCGCDCEAVKTSGARYGCMHNGNNIFAGFPHLYYYSNPDVPHRFLTECRSYSERRP
ncbi:MAG: cobyrinate a,c-diamide synthase [Methanomassiliicoccaceae archaeon]|nr:cobyrinate a,c-diamide synthase [Methanomassiliicoccaceae archaeon]